MALQQYGLICPFIAYSAVYCVVSFYANKGGFNDLSSIHFTTKDYLMLTELFCSV